MPTARDKRTNSARGKSKPSAPPTAAEDDALHWRAYAEAADIKLADERRHADALVEALTKFMWAASPEQHGGTSAYPYEELRDLLAAHAARRAHDSECESEFDSQAYANTPCGCAARRAAAAPLSDAGASSEVANG